MCVDRFVDMFADTFVDRFVDMSADPRLGGLADCARADGNCLRRGHHVFDQQV